VPCDRYLPLFRPPGTACTWPEKAKILKKVKISALEKRTERGFHPLPCDPLKCGNPEQGILPSSYSVQEWSE
jgi:hypothetical protein